MNLSLWGKSEPLFWPWRRGGELSPFLFLSFSVFFSLCPFFLSIAFFSVLSFCLLLFSLSFLSVYCFFSLSFLSVYCFVCRYVGLSPSVFVFIVTSGLPHRYWIIKAETFCPICDFFSFRIALHVFLWRVAIIGILSSLKRLTLLPLHDNPESILDCWL